MKTPSRKFLLIEPKENETGPGAEESSSMIMSAAINVGDVIPIENTATSATAEKMSSTDIEIMITDIGEWYFIYSGPVLYSFFRIAHSAMLENGEINEHTQVIHSL